MRNFLYPPTTGLKPETSNDSAENRIVTFHHKLSCSELREKNGKMNFTNEKRMSSEKTHKKFLQI
jgi:hypothetical protein